MLCLDVSGSMKELDENILRHFVRIAEGLPGDRIGLTIWNGAAISVFPLTEDAEYVDGDARVRRRPAQPRAPGRS